MYLISETLTRQNRLSIFLIISEILIPDKSRNLMGRKMMFKHKQVWTHFVQKGLIDYDMIY